jgi:anaerobic dimethyl sulfoxide reductase subunit C (anchor subunit)
MRSHWSLVAFTLLVQSAAGGIWCLQIALLCQTGWMGAPVALYQILACLGAALLGLAAAMAHLGNPKACFHAIRNLGGSWLSREVSSVSLLVGVMAALAVLAQASPRALTGWAVLAASLAAGLALWAMSRVYGLRTVPTWNHAGTPLNYLGSALLLGGLLFALVTVLSVAEQGPGLFIAFLATLAGFVFKLLAIGVLPPAGAGDNGRFRLWRLALQGLGAAFWLLFLMSGNADWQTALLCLAVASLVTSETMARIKFYNAYHRVGL